MKLETQEFHKLKAEFLKDRFLYHSLGQGAARLIRYEFAKQGFDVFNISWRVKTLLSIIDKTDRKSYTNLRDMTDRLGLRIICMYSHDIKKATDYISRLFYVLQSEDASIRGGSASFGYASQHCLVKWGGNIPGPVQPGDLNRYYGTTFWSNGTVVEETEDKVEKSLFVEIQKKIQREKIEKTISKMNEAAGNLIFEIQIRTVLQHAWASVSHELIYKHESEVSEQSQRKLARLAALLEEVDEAFSMEAERKGFSEFIPSKFPDMPRSKVSPQYLKQYSKEVLGIEITNSNANFCLHILAQMNIHSVRDFEELIAASLEALDWAGHNILILHLRSLSVYLNTLAYWAGVSESYLVPTQLEVFNQYRHLVHEEHFQSVLRRCEKETMRD